MTTMKDPRQRHQQAAQVSPAPTRRGQRLLEKFSANAPKYLARATVLIGLALIADVLLGHTRVSSLLAPMLPRPATATAEAIVLVGGWAMLRLARGLRRAKRAEAHVAIVACVAVIVADLLRTQRRPLEAAVVAALLIALLITRNQFTASADPRGRSYAFRTAVRLLGLAFGVGLVLMYLPGHLPASVSFWSRLREVAVSIAGFGGWIPLRSEDYADFVHATLVILGLLTLVASVLFALRPVEPGAHLDPSDEQRLRALVRTHGARDSLAYFALRRDKSVVWSATGKAAIGYRVLNGVALVSGDPIGDPEAWPGAMAAYRELVDKYGWTPAVMGCSTLGATVFKRECGLAAIELGDEAIVYPESFSLQGRAMRGVRQACTKVQRAGYTAQTRRISDLGQDEIAELITAAAAWRGDDVERGFSMALSRLGDPADADCVVVTARLGDRLVGLLHFVPWSTDGISLDLMRRDRSADNGLNEFMIATLMADAPQLGITRVSLNFAVFRDALERGARIGAGPVLRAWRRVLLIASRWYQIDSLYRFNDKFAPEWQPRYFSYSRVRDMPRIALAALEAEAFVVRPPVMDRVLGRNRRRTELAG